MASPAPAPARFTRTRMLNAARYTDHLAVLRRDWNISAAGRAGET
ncbi:hypothetical protein [Streptomyces sp. NPDC005731]